MPVPSRQSWFTRLAVHRQQMWCTLMVVVSRRLTHFGEIRAASSWVVSAIMIEGWVNLQVLLGDESFTVKQGSVLLTREHIDDIVERVAANIDLRRARGLPIALAEAPASTEPRPPKAVPYTLPEIHLGFERPVLDWCQVGQWKTTCWAPGECTAVWPQELGKADPTCPIYLMGRYTSITRSAIMMHVHITTPSLFLTKVYAGFMVVVLQRFSP